MGIGKLKNVFYPPNVRRIKDYSSLLVPVVTVLAAVLLFIPGQLMSSKLTNYIASESISKRGKQVQLLSRSDISGSQWKVEKEYMEACAEDANQIALIAAQSSRRQLLSYKIFPKPKGISTLIFEQFGQQFRDSVDALIGRAGACDCPTDVELQRSMQSYSSSGSAVRRPAEYRAGRVPPLGGERGSPGMLFKTPYGGSSDAEAAIKDALCRDKAESASVYSNPANLSGYEFWERGEPKSGKSKKSDKFTYTGTDEAVKDCWYYQLAYWIIEDVIDTIGALNSESDSVFTSPVKRLMAVSFTTSDKRSISRKKTAGDRPSYVLAVEDGLTEPWTGRLCNDDIDVVHFNVVVVVSTKSVLPFMQQLCSAKQHKFRGFFGESQEQIFEHNQITILESNIRSIDRGDETHSLYRYGEDAVVELDLTCEYIFNKNGYDKIKPELIKKRA